MFALMTRLALCAALAAPTVLVGQAVAAPAATKVEMPQTTADRARARARSAERARQIQIEDARADAEFARQEQEAARVADEQARADQVTGTPATEPSTQTPVTPPAEVSVPVTPQ